MSIFLFKFFNIYNYVKEKKTKAIKLNLIKLGSVTNALTLPTVLSNLIYSPHIEQVVNIS